MARLDSFPNLFIVGAAKSGTTSLHNYLCQHPDIFMPTFTPEGLKVKEPRFLIKDKVQKRLPKGIWNYQDYKSLFDGSLQGIESQDSPAFGFQGHPEASPGPHDVGPLFDHFIELMVKDSN